MAQVFILIMTKANNHNEIMNDRRSFFHIVPAGRHVSQYLEDPNYYTVDGDPTSQVALISTAAGAIDAEVRAAKRRDSLRFGTTYSVAPFGI